jgi:hypothetical protein
MTKVGADEAGSVPMLRAPAARALCGTRTPRTVTDALRPVRYRWILSTIKEPGPYGSAVRSSSWSVFAAAKDGDMSTTSGAMAMALTAPVPTVTAGVGIANDAQDDGLRGHAPPGRAPA